MRKWTLLLPVIFCLIQLNAQSKPDFKGIDIGNNDDFSGFEVLDTMLRNKQVVMSGEVYSYTLFNLKFEYKLLKYLHKYAGYRNYLLEMGPAKAFIVNEYINSGDSVTEKLLQSVSSVKYMKLYKNLKRLNLKQPDSLRIKVFGVDVERYYALPLVRIGNLLPEDSIPDRLRIGVEALQGAAKYIISKGLEEFDKELEGEDNGYYYTPLVFSVGESINEFLKYYDSLKPEFSAWLGTKFTVVNEAVGWLKEYKEYQGYKYEAYQNIWREEIMYSRISSLMKSMPNDKFFGQFGLCHISRLRLDKACDNYDFSGIVNKMTVVDSNLANKIANIAMFYSFEMNKYSVSFQESNFASASEYFAENGKKNTAYFVSKSAVPDSFNNMFKHYDMLLFNNNFTLNDDSPDLTDTTVDIPKKKRLINSNNYYYEDMLFVGPGYMQNLVKLKSLNSLLQQNGFNKVNKIESYGLMINFSDFERQIVRYYIGWGRNTNAGYKNMRTEIGVGYNLILRDYIKWGFTFNYGYTNHSLSLRDTSKSIPFFTDIKPIITYRNPAIYVGGASSLVLDLEPVFIYAEIGYNWDFSDKRWKLNKEYTGQTGGLSNTAMFYGLGLGVALPIN